MDHRERWGDLDEALRIMLTTLQARMWTSAPGIVESFDPAKGSVRAKLAVRSLSRGRDGGLTSGQFPPLVDVPVVFPGGGGYSLTFPIKPGDECLLVFSCRPIDSWWQSGGVQRPANARMHDLSDAFAFVGPRSLTRPLAGGVSADGVQLRADDGGAFLELSGDRVSIQAPGGVWMNGKRVDDTHTHGGVAIGSNNTEAPS